MPATNSPFLPPPSLRLAARWRQTFLFDPIYLGNPWEFSRNFFTVWYLSPSTLLPYQFYFRFGGRAPKKNFDPQLYKIWSYDLANFWLLEIPKFGVNLTTGFFARWRQSFFFDPKYLNNPWEFSENFSLSDTPPQTLQTPSSSPTNSTSSLGVGPPKIKFWPQLHKILSIDLAVFFWHSDPSWVLLRQPKFGYNLRTEFWEIGENRLFGLPAELIYWTIWTILYR